MAELKRALEKSEDSIGLVLCFFNYLIQMLIGIKKANRECDGLPKIWPCSSLLVP